MTKPPLELIVDVTDASGVRTRWDPNDANATMRPQNLSFSTKRGDGFGEGSVTLARRVDRDWVDLNLFDDVAFVGADGSTAYEGRIGAQPRSFSDTHSITVQLAGWMSHARDKPFSEIYVDRDLGAWRDASAGRKAWLLSGNNNLNSFSVGKDTTTSKQALLLEIVGPWISPYKPTVDVWYDAGPGNQIAAAYFEIEGYFNVLSDPNFYLNLNTADDDVTVAASSADLWAGSNTTYNSTVPGSPRRYVNLQYYYLITPSGGGGVSYVLAIKNLSLIGNHGLSLYGLAPYGVTASDVMKHVVSRHCPKLNTDGVQATNWPIPHLVFRDVIDPYDAFLELNKYHLWEIGVWENKTLTFGPANRSDYDWEVRLSDFGVKVDLQGDSIEGLANGMIVDYQNVQHGVQDRITPNESVELADTSSENPANRAGIQRWAKIQLSSPTTTDSAIQIGRTALIELNQAKSPGSISIQGHIRDRAGHWQQGWKVRAADTIAITDHPNSSPRLITETQWNHDAKELQVSVDSASNKLDALFDRISTSLVAAGLG